MTGVQTCALPIYVEGFAVGAVADGVDAELEPVLDGKLGGLAYVGGIVGIEPAAIGLIGVGGQQPRSSTCRLKRSKTMTLNQPEVMKVGLRKLVP